MTGLRISGSDRLLSHLVAAFVRDRYPDVTVQVELQMELDASLGGVRVVRDGADRWIYISPRPGRDPALAAALNDGACAVLNLDSAGNDLLRAMEEVLYGDSTYVPKAIMRWIAGAAAGSPAADLGLTAREREVLRHVAQGYSNNEIASALVMSPNTVRTHLRALSSKLETSGRTKLIAKARVLDIPEAFPAEDEQQGERRGA